ncbi:unnamed protein product [Didymodactylos carnosus]|uniref:Uncharacterized protein n=1 Tax=Didymodactylos carnosus TaxID=1234261 RepID=A0A8S2E098_9BILA|nr:unnamed protein product [Didymodactylos carnosus]CAF3848850.1 unnamed protein product [Didymodactylos carnosus]
MIFTNLLLLTIFGLVAFIDCAVPYTSFNVSTGCPLNVTHVCESCTEDSNRFGCWCSDDEYVTKDIFTPCRTTIVDPCLGVTCDNGGQCIREGLTQHRCNCTGRFGGLNCEKPLESCIPTTCKNSQCVETDSEQMPIYCQCYDGSKKLPSDNTSCPQNPCFTVDTSEPSCKNGGTCSIISNQFFCTCPEKWTDRECGTEITGDLCSSKPGICGQGVCKRKTSPPKFSCDCGNYPSTFAETIDNLIKCENSKDCGFGSCKDVNGMAACECADNKINLDGTKCPDICREKAVCGGGYCKPDYTLPKKYKCLCQGGLYSNNPCPRFKECPINTCGEDGICVETDGLMVPNLKPVNYVCSCRDGYIALTESCNANQSQRKLGEFCIPGTCASINTNCKRVGGTFRCVCRDQFISVNKTHCLKVINVTSDSSCSNCINGNGVCLDENNDDRMDGCYCPADNALCNSKTTSIKSFIIPVTPGLRKKAHNTESAITIVSAGSSSLAKGELALALYDLNQQRLIENGGSVYLGDRLFIELKYKSDNNVEHQIIAENCSIASGVSDNDPKLEKINLLINRCPSKERFSLRFQRLDPHHIKSTIFKAVKFESTSIAYLRCSVAICFGRTEYCQERICQNTNTNNDFLALPRTQTKVRNFSAVNDVVQLSDSAIVDDNNNNDESEDINLFRRRRGRRNEDDLDEKKLAKLILNFPWTTTTTPIQEFSADIFSTDASLSKTDTNKHFEIRNVQMQFTTELTNPANIVTRKNSYESLYGPQSAQGAERSTVIAAISIIFIIGISVSLFVIYRTCYLEYNNRIYGTNDSIYGVGSTSQVCRRYDMGRRTEQQFDESFFVSNVEPLGAYRRHY